MIINAFNIYSLIQFQRFESCSVKLEANEMASSCIEIKSEICDWIFNRSRICFIINSECHVSILNYVVVLIKNTDNIIQFVAVDFKAWLDCGIDFIKYCKCLDAGHLWLIGVFRICCFIIKQICPVFSIKAEIWKSSLVYLLIQGDLLGDWNSNISTGPYLEFYCECISNIQMYEFIQFYSTISCFWKTALSKLQCIIHIYFQIPVCTFFKICWNGWEILIISWIENILIPSSVCAELQVVGLSPNVILIVPVKSDGVIQDESIWWSVGIRFCYSIIIIGNIEISIVSYVGSPAVFNYPCSISCRGFSEIVFWIIIIPSNDYNGMVFIFNWWTVIAWAVFVSGIPVYSCWNTSVFHNRLFNCIIICIIGPLEEFDILNVEQAV